MFAEGSSSFDVEFEILSAMDYTLEGDLKAFTEGDGFSFADISLSDSNGTIFALDPFGGMEHFMSAGELMPGFYTLSVHAGAVIEASGNTASGHFNFDFNLIPEPAGAILLAVAFWAMAPGQRRYRL